MTQLDENRATVSWPAEAQSSGAPAGPPRVAVQTDQDWDGRAWTGREADRPAAITEADRTQVVPGAAASGQRVSTPQDRGGGDDAESTQWVPRERIAEGDAERTQWVASSGAATPPPAARAAASPPAGPAVGGGGSRGAAAKPVVDGRLSGPEPAGAPDNPPGPAPVSPDPPGSGPSTSARPELPPYSGTGSSRPATATPPPRASGVRPPPPVAPTGAPRQPPSAPFTTVSGPDAARRPAAPPPPPRPVGPRASPSGGWPAPWGDPAASSPPARDPEAPPGRRPEQPAAPAPAAWWEQDDDTTAVPDDAPGEADPDLEDLDPDDESGLAAVPAAQDVAVRGLGRQGLTSSLVASAREAWPPVDAELLDDVVAAGETAHVRALTDPREPVSSAAPATALARTEDATEAAVAVSRLADRHEPGRADWAQAGMVIPVLGASCGIGSSVVAAALFDALDVCGVPTLLVDAADPARSGLASAVANQGAPARTLHPKIGVAYARRGDGWVAQLSAPPTENLSARMVPSPSWWLPDQTAPAATVVDLGWDPWQIAAAPLRGAGSWLEAGHPSSPRPVLVVEPNRPSLAKANGLLTRLRPWISAGHIAAPAGLVVVAARRWPKQITGVAAQALGELMEHAVFLPYDRDVEVGGIGPGPVSDRLRIAAAAIPARWGLMPNNLAPGGGLPSLTSLFSRGR